MKIFEIGTGYTSIPARIGAATELVVEELATSLIKLGADVSVVDIKDRNRKQTNLPIIEAYMPQFFSSVDTKLGLFHKLKRVLYSISLTYTLHSLIKANGSGKLFLHFHNQYNLFFFLKLTPKSMLKNVTIGYTVHSYIWFGKWEEIKETIKKRYFQEVFCCQHADKVFVLNEIVADMLSKHCGVTQNNLIRVINGVNVNTYDDKVVDENVVKQLREKYNLEGKKVVFQVGSVCDRKNQLGTLRLLLPLIKKNPAIAMVYAGGIIDPQYAGAIRQLAEQENVASRVVYMGEVAPGKQLNELYALADVAFMNSKSEAFALVIAEALSARKPIFISDVIMRSLFFLGKKEGEGIIRIKGTFEQDFSKLLNDEYYYKEMQEKGRNFILNEFSWDVAARAYLDSIGNTNVKQVLNGGGKIGDLVISLIAANKLAA